ncbi:sodium:proton antiporter [Pseudooceanicola sp. CBS1P-1]|uniref:Sodium:proton antiporter n=1 Tax=Pseudooceanicola albus TaxID=2692189 RepID=A0A6L7FYY3_9RHOB|nr:MULTISPECIES: sodium:proton antiporter [Pseudooceanicola]MBT9383209.1 sodium:proton antiporter [Pseudooceanicola endophyticus]MXN16468.1 sodium:proton antiporter [Pseudooceanicola albus]
MSLVQIASLLIVLAAVFGTINYLFFRLPASIGILLGALLTSVGMMIFDAFFPGFGLADRMRQVVSGLDFSEALMEGMLGLLLFAGALHVKVADLRSQWKMVLLMATLGVALSTAVVGYAFSWVTGLPVAVALVFGALISPTDPVAVLGILQAAKLRKSLETRIAGESLFNDGVGYVVYLLLVSIAFPDGTAEGHGTSLSQVVVLFAREAGGGLIAGVVLGYLVFRVMRHIDEPALEVLITLALAFGGYELASALGLSAPIMAVSAGLLIGDIGARKGMSERTWKYVEAFWSMIDEILNAVLFMLIGFEVFAVAFKTNYLIAAVIAIGLSLVARLISVAVPILLLRQRVDFGNGTIPIMTWGGLKGGISVALALSLPDSEAKPMILAATYCVVVFSILVQGLTVGRLAQKVGQ